MKKLKIKNGIHDHVVTAARAGSDDESEKKIGHPSFASKVGHFGHVY